MTIDKCVLYGSCKCQTAGCVVLPDEGCPVYRYFKDLIVKDYENRLKTDMVAILVELQVEIEESENCGKAFHLGLQMASNIIQQKINELETKSEGKNE